MTTATGPSSDATATATSAGSSATISPKNLTARKHFESSKLTIDAVKEFDWSVVEPQERFNRCIDMLTQCICLCTASNTYIVRVTSETGMLIYVPKDEQQLIVDLKQIIFKNEKQKSICAKKMLEEEEFMSSIAKYKNHGLMSDDPNTIATWSGFPEGEYHQEYIDEMMLFLESNIVEAKARELLLNTFAWLVQHNWKKQNYGFLLIGTRAGEGKTTLTNMFASLVPNNCSYDATFELVTGPFNGWMHDVMLIIIDEISSNKKSNSEEKEALKRFTNKKWTYHYKFKNVMASLSNDNYSVLFGCTNHMNCRGIYEDAGVRRRMVPMKYQRKYTNFKKINSIIEQKDFGATLAQYLRNRDIGDFEPYDDDLPGQMEVMKEIIEVSQNHIYDFAEELTKSNFTLVTSERSKYKDKYAITVDSFTELYADWCKKRGVSNSLDYKAIKAKLSEYMVADRVSVGGKQQRVYIWLKDLPEGDPEDVIVQDNANLDAE